MLIMLGNILPLVNRLQCFIKCTYDLGRSWPLHMFTIILQGPNILETLAYLPDIRFHLVFPVVIYDGVDSSCAFITKSSYGSPPDL